MRHSDPNTVPAQASPPTGGVFDWHWNRNVRATGRSRDPIRSRWHEAHLIRARRDDVSAQFMVGFHYEKGYGVVRDYAEAYRWYAIAKNHGYAPAALAKERVARKLSPDERNRAEHLVGQWCGGRLSSAHG